MLDRERGLGARGLSAPSTIDLRLKARRLKTWYDEPTSGPSGVDQLLGGEARPRTQVGEVALRGTRPNAHELGGVLDGSASSDVGGEHVHLALRRLRRERASQVPVSHHELVTPG